jgi:1-phosphatidylinositol-3-phosphate 5-kinase
MAEKDGQDAPSPSTSSIRLPLGPLTRASRRGSWASTSSRAVLDKETLNLALDQIHTTASRSETLITFDEFASPPQSAQSNDSKRAAADYVPGGLSGLYSRIRATVGNVKDAATGASSSSANEAADDASVSSPKTKGGAKAGKFGIGIGVSSPVNISAPSSRLNSPLATTFPDPQPPNVRQADPQNLSKSNFIAPRSPLILASKSKPTVAAPALESLNISAIKDEDKRSPLTANTISSSGSRSKDVILSPTQTNSSASSRILGDARSRSGSQVRVPRETASIEEYGSINTAGDDPILGNNLPEGPFGLSGLPEAHAVEDSQAKEALRRMSSTNASSSARKDQVIPPMISFPSDLDANERLLPGPSFNTAQRPPLLQISQSHLPGYGPSRTSSSDYGVSSVASTLGTIRQAQPSSIDEPFQATISSIAENPPNNTLSHMRRRVLGKEFWMRDENAKDCFNCGDSFSAFRRKHHCRKYNA